MLKTFTLAIAPPEVVVNINDGAELIKIEAGCQNGKAKEQEDIAQLCGNTKISRATTNRKQLFTDS